MALKHLNIDKSALQDLKLIGAGISYKILPTKILADFPL